MKILYVHGFASSGQSGTVERLHQQMPGVTVVAPDLPVNPQEALAMLHEVVEKEVPDLVIGTSMGAMYAQQLRGVARVLINPSFYMSEHLKQRGFGRTPWLNPRRDGAKDFLIDGALVKAFQEMEASQFDGALEEDSRLVWGLFGLQDTTVTGCDKEFLKYYPQLVYFQGEHRVTDKVLVQSVLPVVRWLTDEQNGAQKMRLLIHVDTLREEGAAKAFAQLESKFDTYVVGYADWNCPEVWGERVEALQQQLGVAVYRRLLMVPDVSMLHGDFLIVPASESQPGGVGGRWQQAPLLHEFEGFVLPFGEAPCANWQQLLLYFENI